MRPALRAKCAFPEPRPRVARAPPSGLRSRPPRLPCWRARACGGKARMVPNSDPADSPRGVAARCGFVAVIGAPNAGKSTLVNALVGAKVSIVTRKVQTTRAPVRGVLTEGSSQLVFIDTPGIFAPRRRLDRAMVDAAWA